MTRAPEKAGVYLARINRSDGLIAVIHGKLMARGLANYFDMTYVDMNIESISHEPADLSQEAYGKAGERFFGLGEKQLKFESVRGSAHVHYVKHLEDLSHEPGTLNVLGTEKRNWKRKLLRRPGRMRPLATPDLELQLAGIAPDLKTPADVFVPIQEQLRKVYDCGPSRRVKTDYESDRLDVAIHIRRGDIVADQLWRRFTPNAYYSSVIRQLKTLLEDQPFRVHIFSETKPKPSLLDEDFSPFEDLGCCMHLDEDVFETVHHLVTADVLVTSRSSFSYVPGVLSRGVVLYEPFWHSPMSSWIVCDGEGRFDGERFRILLQDAAWPNR